MDHNAPGVKTRKGVEKLQQIYLVGHTSQQITGGKLPSNRQVLQVLFYNMRFVGLDKKESAKLVIDLVKIFWRQARIPIREEHKCEAKLIKMYEKWTNIKKTAPNKMSNSKKQELQEFEENLDNLFDISQADALEKIKIEEDRKFLKMQRQKGRPGCMAGADIIWNKREKRVQERREKEAERKKRYEEELLRPDDSQLAVFSGEANYSQSLESSYEDSFNHPHNELTVEDNASKHTSVSSRGRKSFITGRLVGALDNAKVSDGMAVHILIAAAEALGHLAAEFSINRRSIQRARHEYRLTQSKEISHIFMENIDKSGSLVAHFDGKMMQDIII